MAQPILIAHRGYSAISPENSFLAFELAYQFCFLAVELDVHLTKDQQLVIIHDAVSYTHLTLPTNGNTCRSRWSPYH